MGKRLENNRKKVLIFTPGNLGGAERMSVLVAKFLPKEQFYVKIVVIGRLRKIYDAIPKDIEVDCIPVLNIYAFSTLRIWWKILREKPDIIFSSQEAYNGRVIIASKMANKPVVVRSSNMIGKYKPSLRRQVSYTYPKADLLIAQQEEMRQEMLRILKVQPERIITIRNLLDTGQLDVYSAAPSPYTSDGKINYVNIARVCYAKAQDITIRAFSKVKAFHPNANLYFVGGFDKDSRYYKELDLLIKKLGLTDCIFFVGFDNNPYRWVKNSDCFILPSRVEGLPNALVEASYLGVPCIASRCLKIIDEIIIDGQNGFTVEVDDVEGLANAMIKAISIKRCDMVYSPGKAEDFANAFERVLSV